MEENKISIVIPCFNDASFIQEAVDSALNQTYKNIEVIVIDDGSNAETKSVLKKLEYKVTKLITQENKGQSAARNRGIEIAKGEFILVLDSDDFFEPSFCEKALLIFEHSDIVKIVTCKATLLYENGMNEFHTPAGGDISSFLISNSALGTSMFRKSDWENCGGYDENMRKGFEDWEFFIRILKGGGTAEVIQEPLYNYRKRDNSTTFIANSKKYELLKYIYLKHSDIYKIYYADFINYLLSRIEREELDKIKNTKKIDFKIGSFLLFPFRKIKSLFK